MKKILLVLTGLLMLSCAEKQRHETELEPNDLTQDTEHFDWLLGKWKRTNEVEGKETFESWQKTQANEYVGFGYTIQNNDTIWQEKMQLRYLEGKWNLTVKVPDEAQSIVFYGVSHTQEAFTCENLDNDFPNLIKYQKNGEKIHAEIAGGEIQITYDFERLKE